VEESNMFQTDHLDILLYCNTYYYLLLFSLYTIMLTRMATNLMYFTGAVFFELSADRTIDTYFFFSFIFS